MALIEAHFPDVYVMSKLPGIAEYLQDALPSNVKVIKVNLSDNRVKYDKTVKVQPEEIESIQNAEILVVDSMFIAQMMYDLPHLKWAQSTWTGVEMIFEEVDKSRPYPNFKLTRYVDPYFGELMANYVTAQIINIERKFYDYQEKQKISEWSRPFFPDFRVLSDLTVGLLGAGKLGLSVGERLAREGSKLKAYVRNLKNGVQNECNIEFTTDLSLILRSCDYICNVLPSTPETRGLLDGNILKECRKKPVFINIGRGDIITEENIIAALKNGWISKAILDVFEEEPLSPSSSLWQTPNVIITPHVGAIPRISESAKLIAENYKLYISGKKLLNEVDWNKGY